MQYFQEIFPSSNPNHMQDTVKVVANQVQDQFKADYGLASVPVCRRVIIHTLLSRMSSYPLGQRLSY
jgi:hypothetical protein